MQSARGFEYGVQHIISPQSGWVCSILAQILGTSDDEILFLLDLGSIYLNHQRLQKNSSVSAGDYLRVHTKPRRFLADDGNWHQRILFKNSDFVIVNKPSSLPVHSSVDNIRENLQAYLQKHLNQTVYVTHRLDVPTRGLILYALSAEFQSEFNKLLIQREMTKIYRARVQGHPPIGIWRHFMEPSPRAPKKVQREIQDGWQECLLEVFESQDLGGGTSEVKIKLLTGRTHQIRAQLSCEGSPILNDHAYGAKKLNDLEAIELEACQLEFQNPLSGESFLFKL